MLKIINEIWITMADLAYRARDIKYSVTNKELQNRIAELFSDRRPGVYTHISQHVVAQKRLNTGYNKCYLTEVKLGRRRLFVPGDMIHDSRSKNPQMVPKLEELPSEYRYLLDWYLDLIGKNRFIPSSIDDNNIVSVSSVISTKKTFNNDWFTLSNFVLNFHRAYENFYQSKASYRYFKKGPCIHFHIKAINIWKGHICRKKADYFSLLSDDTYIEAIYATLTAWGMNSLIGGPKLKDYDLFKKNLISLSDNLEKIRDFDILTIQEAKETIKKIYSHIDPSENVRDLVAKSKTLHHLHPNIFPPIDNSYTLNLLAKLKDLRYRPNKYSINLENFWKVLCCFRDIINQIGKDKIVQYLGKKVMDTSLTKIVDNAIIGFSDLTPM